MSTSEDPPSTLEPTSEMQALINMLSDGFESHQRTDLIPHVKRLVYKESSSPHRYPASMTDLLASDALINQPFLQYEKWHFSALQRLEPFRLSCPASLAKLDAFLNRLCNFHSRLLGQAVANWQKQDKTQGIGTGSHLSQAPQPIILEIMMGVDRYSPPVTLLFHPGGSFELQGCSTAGSSPSTLGLIVEAECNRPTLTQLRWIDAVLSQLTSAEDCLELTPIRREEMINGLQEHRKNIVAYVETARFRCTHGHLTVRTITTNIYRPILLFPPDVVMTAITTLSLRYLYQMPRRAVVAFLEMLRTSMPAYGLSSKRIEDAPCDPQIYKPHGVIGKLDMTWNAALWSQTELSKDFWEVSYVRTTRGSDYSPPISTTPPDETRLLPSLALDSFDSFHNRTFGAFASTGVFRPLLDELLTHWEKGECFIGISGLNAPCLIRCTLVQIISDLPPARKVAGLSVMHDRRASTHLVVSRLPILAPTV